MTPPVVNQSDLDPAGLDAALREWGGFLVRWEDAAALERMLSATRQFFARPAAEKAALAIEGSAHFRGWSEMRNERDWREQLHLGWERPSVDKRADFWRLEGPNLWPDDNSWRAVVSAYVAAATTLGESVLRALASVIDVDAAELERYGRDGYQVAKLIGYHPQPSAEVVRSGVAAHVDFSWVTVNLQDSAGLEVRRPDGTWVPVDVTPGVVWVHAGEVLQHASGGRWMATPHRVLNRSVTRTRVSVPVFVNPPLDSVVPIWSAAERAPCENGEHVHRVLDPSAPREAFHFGTAEWRRKGLGGWCHACQV